MRNIWAVAVNTIRQALRMKIVLAFLLILLILIPVMALGVTGDGTIKGQLQSFVTYSMGLTALILSIMTIVLTTFSLADDIKEKRIYTVITKPIRRFELLLGKLIGVIVLDTGALIFCASLIYAATIYIPNYYKITKEQLEGLKDEFYTARISIKPPVPDVTEEVIDLYKKLAENQQLPEDMSTQAIIQQLRSQKMMEKRAVAPGQEKIWEFTDVKLNEPNQSLFIRFKYDVAVNPPDNTIHSLWEVGDLRQINFSVQSATPFYSTKRRDVIRTFREFSVPAEVVAADGYLGIAFLNAPVNPTVVIFPPEDGLEVLYKAGEYTTNFTRTILLILFRLIFLACLGIFASSFLSFPVAILVCLTVFVFAISRGFILESFKFVGPEAGFIYNYTIKMLVRTIPQFDKLNPADFLASARLLSWSAVGKLFALVILLKSGLILIFALIIFSYREIAKIAL